MPFTTPDYLHEPLYVITAVYNPIRFKARWKLYERFAKHVKESGGVLITVEASFGERHHALEAGVTQHETLIHQAAPTKDTEFHKARSTEPHQYVQVQTDDELWIKENLINIGISRLPQDWKYVAWIDADVLFARPNWVGETVQQLQHYQVVQLFSHVTDVGPRYMPVAQHQGFMYNYLHNAEKKKQMPGGYYQPPIDGMPPGVNMWHPGYAWGARREAIDALGGLMDFGILGAADNHMAHALIGEGAASVHPEMREGYLRRVMEWEWRAEHLIRRNVGYVSGLLIHFWHGKKVDRHYWDRWRVLVDHGFDPDVDIKKSGQGVLQLEDRGVARSVALRDALRAYHRSRNEDSLDVD